MLASFLESVEEVISIFTDPDLLTLEHVGRGVGVGEHLHGLGLRSSDLAVGLVEALGDGVSDGLGHRDGVNRTPELVEDVVLSDVDLTLVTADVNALPVTGSVVVVHDAVRLLLWRVGNLGPRMRDRRAGARGGRAQRARRASTSGRWNADRTMPEVAPILRQ